MKYGWIKINGIYYPYNRELCCIPSCTQIDYVATKSKVVIKRFIALLNMR